MSEYLLKILEGYKARSGDEENFMKKHTDNVQEYDAPGAEETKKIAKDAKYSDRNKEGYDPEEDEEVYEELSDEEIEQIFNESVNELLEELDEADRELLLAMSEEENFFDNLISDIFEEKDDDDDEEDDDDDDDDDDDEEDDDDDDDDDDEIVDTNPKMNKEKKDMQESFSPGIPDAPFASELGIKAKGAFAHHPSVEEELKEDD